LEITILLPKINIKKGQLNEIRVCFFHNTDFVQKLRQLRGISGIQKKNTGVFLISIALYQ